MIEEKRCKGDCGQLKPLTDFYQSYKGKDKVYYRSECNACHVRITNRYILNKRREKNPQNYQECDGCDETCKATFNFCPYCGFNLKVQVKVTSVYHDTVSLS